MGSLEELKASAMAWDEATRKQTRGQDADRAINLCDAMTMNVADWLKDGCPPYDPEPEGAPGAVPRRDGVYAVSVAGGMPLVMVLRDNGKVITMEGALGAHDASSLSLGAARFRFLAPTPQSPDDA